MSLPTFKIHAWGTRLTVFAFVLGTIFCFNLWRPKRQIELHQKNLLLAVEDKSWRRLEGLLSEQYHDRFGHNRKSSVSDLREVMRSFFSATIRTQGTQIELAPAGATVTTYLTLSGNGPGVPEMITSRVNQLTDPWVFTWKKESSLPWDWKLISADNAGLNVGDRSGGF